MPAPEIATSTLPHLPGRLAIVRNRPAVIAKAEAVNSDSGQTRTPFRLPRQLPNPRCQSGLVRWTDPRRLRKVLFVDTGIPVDTRAAVQRFRPMEGLTGRQRLAAYLSRDDCRTWSEIGVRLAGASACQNLAVLPDDDVLCLYEGGEKGPDASIRMARLDKDWLSGRPSSK